MKRIDIYGMGTRTGPSFLEGLGTDNFVSRLILSNNLLYNLCYFQWESLYLEKSSLSKMVYIEQRIIFPCIWHIK